MIIPNWSSVLWSIGILFIIYFLSKAAREIMRIRNVSTMLNVDIIEVLKRSSDYNSLKEYLDSKYEEKEELLRFKLLKLLREKTTDEEDEEEKEFLKDTIGLLEDSENKWQVVESVKAFGGYYRSISFGRWKKVWGKAKISTIIEIMIAWDYKNGGLEKRYQVTNLSEPILKEIQDLQLCQKYLL